MTKIIYKAPRWIAALLLGALLVGLLRLLLRPLLFQLGRHGEIKGGKIAPVRSSSALVLSSTNSNRERIYIQQPPIAASGETCRMQAP